MPDDTCCICHDPLLSPPTSTGGGSEPSPCLEVGAAIPCGHVYHFACFRKWEAASRGRATKCCLCNNPTSQFVKIFIAASGKNGDGDSIGDDDISLSSIDSNQTEDDEKVVNEASDSTPTGKPAIEETEGDGNASAPVIDEHNLESSSATALDTSQDVCDTVEDAAIVDLSENDDGANLLSTAVPSIEDVTNDSGMIDLTQSPSRTPNRHESPPSRAEATGTTLNDSSSRRKRSNHSSGVGTESEEGKRLYKIAKRYKHKFLKTTQSLERQRKRHNDLQHDHQETQVTLREKLEEIQDVQELVDDANLELEGIRLAELRDSRERESLQREMRALKSTHDNTVAELKILKDTHVKEVSKARHDNLVEVKTMMKEYPILQRENLGLKEEKEKLMRLLHQLPAGGIRESSSLRETQAASKQRRNCSGGPSNSAFSLASSVTATKAHSHKSIAKSLRRMENARMENARPKHPPKKAPPPKVSDKTVYSHQASRFHRASLAQLHRKQKSSSLLDVAGSTTSKSDGLAAIGGGRPTPKSSLSLASATSKTSRRTNQKPFGMGFSNGTIHRAR